MQDRPKGFKIHIHASAKHPSKGSKSIVFRVNEFDLETLHMEDSE